LWHSPKFINICPINIVWEKLCAFSTRDGSQAPSHVTRKEGKNIWACNMHLWLLVVQVYDPKPSNKSCKGNIYLIIVICTPLPALSTIDESLAHYHDTGVETNILRFVIFFYIF